MMHRLPIALMARERGLDVHIACGEGPGAEGIIKEGFPFHSLPMTRDAFAPTRDAVALMAMVRLYRRLQPDIVHHVTLKPIMYGSIAAKIAGVPAVVNAFAGLGYAFSGTSASSRLRRWAILRVLSRAMRLPRQKVLFENHDDYSLLTDDGTVARECATVIAGVGVDTTAFARSSEPPGPVRVLLAGRMLRRRASNTSWKRAPPEAQRCRRAVRARRCAGSDQSGQPAGIAAQGMA